VQAAAETFREILPDTASVLMQLGVGEASFMRTRKESPKPSSEL
jgi:hypothetical protein